MKSVFLLFALIGFLRQGFAQDEPPIVERIEAIEEDHNFSKHKGRVQAVASGELLYWKANVDGVAYDTTSIVMPAIGGFGNLSSNVKTRTPHFGYDPGFRLGLGVQSVYDLFDVCLVWTRFYTEGHDRAHGTLVPALVLPGDKIVSLGIGLIHPLTSVPNFASAKCHIKENLLDLQLARGIKVSHHFFMRPYFGLRGVWSSVHWNIELTRPFLMPAIFDQDAARLKVKNNFDAAGGLIGFEIDWRLPFGLGISARTAGALVYGLMEEKTKELYRFVAPLMMSASKQKFHAHNSFHTVKGLWELFAGVYWESPRLKKKRGEKRKELPYVRLFAGYEFQQWPFFGQKTNTQSDRQRERFSLGFEGFTGGIRIVF